MTVGDCRVVTNHVTLNDSASTDDDTRNVHRMNAMLFLKVATFRRGRMERRREGEVGGGERSRRRSSREEVEAAAAAAPPFFNLYFARLLFDILYNVFAEKARDCYDYLPITHACFPILVLVHQENCPVCSCLTLL